MSEFRDDIGSIRSTVMLFDTLRSPLRGAVCGTRDDSCATVLRVFCCCVVLDPNILLWVVLRTYNASFAWELNLDHNL